MPVVIAVGVKIICFASLTLALLYFSVPLTARVSLPTRESGFTETVRPLGALVLPSEPLVIGPEWIRSSFVSVLGAMVKFWMAVSYCTFTV